MDPILKGQLVQVALKHLSISGTLINPSGQDQEDFLQFLEMMVSSWRNDGILIGYRLSDFGIDADATEDSGVQIENSSAVALCLACYGATAKGLMISSRLSGDAYQAKVKLHPSEIIERQPNSMLPTGAGNNPYGYRGTTYQAAEVPITIEDDGNLGDLII